MQWGGAQQKGTAGGGRERVPSPLRLSRGFPMPSTWPEARGAGSRQGYERGSLWRGAPARTGCFSGLATRSSEESSRRNAAFPECLVVNTDIQGRGAAGEEEMDSPYGAAPSLARPEHTRKWFLN